MQLFNNGERKIVLSNQEIEPKTLFEVADKEGKKLIELFAGEIIEPPVAGNNNGSLEELQNDLAKVQAERDEANDRIKELEAQLADFDAIKAERDEAKKIIEKLEAQIEKLKTK